MLPSFLSLPFSREQGFLSGLIAVVSSDPRQCVITAHKPSLNIGSVNEQIKNKHQRHRGKKGEVWADSSEDSFGNARIDRMVPLTS